jgi:hypothetical protein
VTGIELEEERAEKTFSEKKEVFSAFTEKGRRITIKRQKNLEKGMFFLL